MALQDFGILKKFYYDTLNPPLYIPLPKYKNEQPIGNDNINHLQKIPVTLICLWVCRKG